MPSEACLEEFEALTAIFLDEIELGEEQADGATKVSMILYPATGDDQESKFVTLTLELTLQADYPKVSPLIRFRNPRGLSESLLDSLYRTMIQTCSERLESQMIFELIDMGKEFLTIHNRPASECPICLLSFTPCDTFFRSRCFHHFHSYCLGRYLHSVMQAVASGEHLPGDMPSLTCPVCRERLDDGIDVHKLLDSPRPFEESLEIVDGDAILKEWHVMQEKLKSMFDKQKRQGGIIDLNEIEKKRLVISSPRGADSDSPSSSFDASTAGESDVVLHEGAAAPERQINLNSNARTETRSKPSSERSTVCRPVSQNCQREVKQPVANAKTEKKSEESADGVKTSPPIGRRRNGHHGNHGHHGHSRRRFK